MSIAVVKAPVKAPAKPKQRRMLLGEFLKKLTATTEWFDWRINRAGWLRAKRISKKGKGRYKHCLITAAAFLESGEDFRPTAYPAAARKLGLIGELARRIARAADDRNCERRGIASLRSKLLRALNLTEK